MSAIQDNSHHTVGVAFAAIAAIVPDWLLSTGEKLVVAVVTAFLTGMAYKLGQVVFSKIRGKDD